MASQKRSRSGPRFGSQISAEAELRYAPQIDALAALLKQATSDRDLGLQVQRTTREGLVQTARGAQPSVQQALQSALGTIDQALQGVPVQGLMASDIAATKSRLADQMARTGTELAARQNDAASGYAAGVRGVQSQYGSDRGKIADQLRSLAGQEGAFKSSRLAELLGEESKQDFTAGEKTKDRATSLLTAGVDSSGKVIPGGKADKPGRRPARRLPGGAKLLSPEKHGSFQDQVESLVAWIEAHRGDYDSRHEIAQDLSMGVAPSKVPDPDSGQEVSDPGVPKAKSQLALSVALDLAYDGKLSRHGLGGAGNVGRLHRRGYSVKRLGYPVQPARGVSKPLMGLPSVRPHRLTPVR